jgi:hypothetical protein
MLKAGNLDLALIKYYILLLIIILDSSLYEVTQFTEITTYFWLIRLYFEISIFNINTVRIDTVL